MKNVHILGAGIGGISIAHLLAKKYPEYTIYVYERNNIIGGQARSSRDADGNFQEYCWHAFGSCYKNLFNLLEEAGLMSRLKPVGKYLYDSTTTTTGGTPLYIEEKKNFLGTCNIFTVKHAFTSLGVNFSLHDIIELIRFYFQINKYTIFNKISYDCEDNIAWKDIINVKDKMLYKWLVGFPSIYLGMDANKVSAGTVLNVARSSINKNTKYDFYIPDGPINERILDPWMEYLISKYNINFMLNSEITKLECKNSLITSITINNTDKIILKPGLDIVINSLDVGGWTDIIHNIETNYKVNKFDNYKHNWRELRYKSYQIQTQILFELNEYVNWNSTNGIFVIIMETPWCLMIRVESNIWDKPEGEFLSCGIGDWNVPSELYNKSIYNMNLVEIANECWHQICKYGTNIISSGQHVKGISTGKCIKDIGYKNYRCWPYTFVNNKIYTNEPKFSNNVDCYKLRPKPIDDYFGNVYHVNAYTRHNELCNDTPDLYCMENAATIAHIVSNLI